MTSLVPLTLRHKCRQCVQVSMLNANYFCLYFMVRYKPTHSNLITMPKWQKQHTATSNLQKVDFKGQVLNTKWPDEFFVQHSNEALCLL